ncbi:hypothetical protein KJ612_15205, partial [Myxococcota bacterium]|nr:hypothetical protein [Myxococcota bacterium]
SGLDLNGSGVLDLGEVTSTQYVCNGMAGADGSDGTDGLTSLVRVTLESAGANCADGGLKLESGLDANGSGVLDLGEITQTQYVCHGVDGLDGVDGSDGLAGFNSLVALTLELAGANCAAGGTKVQSGLDTDADSTLDAGEVTSTRYVCNGIAGSDGADGVTSLVATSIEPAGANCAAGGTKVQSGPDTDGDNTLDAGEVTSTQYVCHGEDGSDLLLRASNAAWGGVCTFGGVKLETGVDLNANGTLDDPEVTRTQYVCNQNRRFVAMSAGFSHTCALKVDGSLWCWGSNGNGALGDGTTMTRLVPVLVSGMDSGVSMVSCGEIHTCALKTDGSAWCWGYNGHGALGDGTTTNRSVPVLVSGIVAGGASISAGGYHTCLVKTDGAALCWGYNGSGQLGNNEIFDESAPVQVFGLASGASTISSGRYHTCAVKTDGSAVCWGNNTYGQLGNGSTLDRDTPVAVSGFSSGIASIEAGGYHTCSKKTNGSGWCWGSNSFGQLGDSTTTDRLTPTAVTSLGSGVVSIESGFAHSCAVKTNGYLWCWGGNGNGQIGDGSTTTRLVPVPVNLIIDQASMIAAGESHTCAVKNDGSGWCWGSNALGQFGNGTKAESSVPLEVYAIDLAP